MAAIWRTVTGRVADVKRARVTASGNPRLTAWIETAESPLSIPYVVEPDSQIAYAIENSEFREQEHLFSLKDGRIVRATPAE